MAKTSLRDRMNSIDLNRMVQDFQGLDPNNPGMWPLLPRVVTMIAVLAATIAAAWWFDWKPLSESLEASRKAELELRNKWRAKKAQAVNLESHKQQLADIDREFGALLRQLPNKAEMDSLLADINQAGLGRGLLFELFKPGNDVIHDFYAEMPIQVQVAGSYHDLGAFAEDVAHMPRIVTLQDIGLTMNDDGTMVLKGKAVTYRYLDDEEMAAQRSAKNAAAKGR